MISSNNKSIKAGCEYHSDTEEAGGKSIKPEIDILSCNGCGGCVELAPEIFRFNDDFGFFEVIECENYNPELVMEAVKNCPKKAIIIDGD